LRTKKGGWTLGKIDIFTERIIPASFAPLSPGHRNLYNRNPTFGLYRPRVATADVAAGHDPEGWRHGLAFDN